MSRKIKGMASIGSIVLSIGLACTVRAETDRRSPVVRAVEKALPSVVNISTEYPVAVQYREPERQRRSTMFDRLLDEFRKRPDSAEAQDRHSLGSGIVIHPRGYLLTNFHVTERASRIQVVFADGSTREAVFLAGDELNDLALIKVETSKPLTAMEFLMQDVYYLGETAIAMGNPFGLSQTVTVGVLSAMNREARYDGQVLFRDILQTDAAINPGSSGGPLLDINGRLLGVNVAFYEEGQRIGFAVPAGRVRRLLTEWMDPDLLQNLSLGFEVGMSKGVLAVTASLSDQGVLVGDVIRAINGIPIFSTYDFYQALLGLQAGDSIKISLTRQARDVTITIKARPMSDKRGLALAAARLGLTLEELGPGEKGASPRKGESVVVKGVSPRGAADQAHIQAGVVLTKINGIDVNNLEDVGVILDAVKAGDRVELVTVTYSGLPPTVQAGNARVFLTAQ